MLKRGADPNCKDAEGETAKDVVGSDLTEDSREIVHTLLKQHAEKAKAIKQRRGSCPAIPRTVLTAAAANAASVSASAGAGAGAAAVFPSSLPSSDKNLQALQPLPSVGVTLLVDRAAKPSNRHMSFSAAHHIRVRKQCQHIIYSISRGG